MSEDERVNRFAVPDRDLVLEKIQVAAMTHLPQEALADAPALTWLTEQTGEALAVVLRYRRWLARREVRLQRRVRRVPRTFAVDVERFLKYPEANYRSPLGKVIAHETASGVFEIGEGGR